MEVVAERIRDRHNYSGPLLFHGGVTYHDRNELSLRGFAIFIETVDANNLEEAIVLSNTDSLTQILDVGRKCEFMCAVLIINFILFLISRAKS